ncbi:hypothetical protein D9M71_249520 [compost metagenome]
MKMVLPSFQQRFVIHRFGNLPNLLWPHDEQVKFRAICLARFFDSMLRFRGQDPLVHSSNCGLGLPQLGGVLQVGPDPE